MCPCVGSHAPSCERQLSGDAQPCGLSPSTGGIAPASLRYDRLTSLAASQATPSWAVCRLSCLRLLLWLLVTFAKVPDAARPGSDQWPWSTGPTTGPVGRLGGPSASDPWGLICCAVSLCSSRCVCTCGGRGLLPIVRPCVHPVCSVCSVRGHLALVHRCARCVWHARDLGGFAGLPTPSSLFMCLFLFTA